MKIVNSPLPELPAACIASGRSEGQFIDTGRTVEGPVRITLSAATVHAMSEMAGLDPAGYAQKKAALEAERAALRVELAALATKVAEAQRFEQAAERLREIRAAEAIVNGEGN